jgi:hypothetical protein
MSSAMVKQASTQVASIGDIKTMASVMVQSGMFPSWNTVEKMMTLMLLCRAEGKDPATVVTRYDCIEGKPTKKPQAMLQDFIEMGGKVEWIESTDRIAKAQFTLPDGREHIEEYTWNDVSRAGNQNKNNYKKYPKAMLRARCLSSGFRAVWPGATSMMYAPEEIQDGVDDEPLNVTPASERPVQAMFQQSEGSAEVHVPQIITEAIEDADVTTDDERGLGEEFLAECGGIEAVDCYLAKLGWGEWADLKDTQVAKIATRRDNFVAKVKAHAQGDK